MRMDAEDEQLGVSGGTPRTIEGPLYVVGAPVEQICVWTLKMSS